MTTADEFVAACGRGVRDEILAALALKKQRKVKMKPADVGRGLHAAATHGHWEVLQWFEQYNSHHEQYIKSEIITPLTAACAAGVVSDVEAQLLREEVQVLLVERDGCPQVLLQQAKELAKEAIQAAISNHHLDIVKALVVAGIDVNQKVPLNFFISAPALRLAIDQDDLDIAGYLLANGAIAEYETDDQFFHANLLRPAIIKGNREMLKLLIRYGARHGWAEIAVEREDMDLIHFLIAEGVDPTNVNKDGESLLHVAIRASNAAIAKLLIEEGHNVLALDKHDRTVMHATSDVDCIKLLLERGIDLNAQDENGRTALHACCDGWKQPNDTRVNRPIHPARTHILEMLLEYDAKYDVKVLDKDDLSPLHLLLSDDLGDEENFLHEVSLLLDAGAEVDATTKAGDTPLVTLLRARPRFQLRYGDRKGRGREFLSVMRLLCSHGATWDTRCEERLKVLEDERALCWEHHGKEMVDEGGDVIGEIDNIDRLVELDDEIGACLGDRACFEHWAEEKAKGIELVQVEYEVYARGEEAIRVWLKDVQFYKVSRSKICVVGPSKWGKTSLIKSITLQHPSLADEDDRTVGIDLFPFEFQEQASDKEIEGEVKKHEVTLWDFAGQDVYHAAHALFFSKRTLYWLCVDLQLYWDSLSNPDKLTIRKHEAVMARFVEDHVIRWVELILARHPDAELLIVGTKKDTVDDDAVIRKIWNDLKARLGQWRANHAPADQEKLKRAFRNEWTVVSSVDQASVQLARKAAERAVITSERGFVMGDKYHHVLEWIMDQRKQANDDAAVETRVEALVRPTATLFRELLEIDGLEYDEASTILRVFHDLGIIIWYDKTDHGSDALQKNIILDPHLIISLVKEVISHKQVDGGETKAESTLVSSEGLLTHTQLCSGTLWKQLEEDRELMQAFKRLLQYNELAYPAKSDSMDCNSDLIVPANSDSMDWDSDLIVPAYWKIRPETMGEAAAAEALSESWQTSVAWKYENVPARLSSIVWRQFAVQSSSRDVERKISASTITDVFTGENSWEARIVLLTEGGKNDVIRIDVGADDTAAAWLGLSFYVMKMEKVLDKYPGLSGDRRVLVGTHKRQEEEWRKVSDIIKILKDAEWLGLNPDELRQKYSWLPPNDFSWFIEKAWNHPSKLEEIKMRVFVRENFQRTDVLHKLVVRGEQGRLVPALWTAEYDVSAGRLCLSMLSDLSGKCYHEPIAIAVPSSFLVKHAAVAKAGLWVCSTVIPEILTLGLVQKVIDKPALDSSIQQAQTVHNLIDKLDLREPTNSKFSSVVNGSNVLTPTATRALLRDLLKLHDPEFDERQISELSKLQCAVSESGSYVWASQDEIKDMGDKLTPCEPSYADVVADSQRFKAVATKYLKLHLVLDRVEGLSSWDNREVSVSWSLFPNSGSKTLAVGTTKPSSKNRDSSAWASCPFELSCITSVAMLRECRLCVYVKRPSRWMGSLKSIGDGEVALDAVILADADAKTLSAALKIGLTGSPSGRVVVGRIAAYV